MSFSIEDAFLDVLGGNHSELPCLSKILARNREKSMIENNIQDGSHVKDILT
jgi:hypothetical protein